MTRKERAKLRCIVADLEASIKRTQKEGLDKDGTFSEYR